MITKLNLLDDLSIIIDQALSFNHLDLVIIVVNYLYSKGMKSKIRDILEIVSKYNCFELFFEILKKKKLLLSEFHIKKNLKNFIIKNNTPAILFFKKQYNLDDFYICVICIKMGNETVFNNLCTSINIIDLPRLINACFYYQNKIIFDKISANKKLIKFLFKKTIKLDIFPCAYTSYFVALALSASKHEKFVWSFLNIAKEHNLTIDEYFKLIGNYNVDTPTNLGGIDYLISNNNYNYYKLEKRKKIKINKQNRIFEFCKKQQHTSNNSKKMKRSNMNSIKF